MHRRIGALAAGLVTAVALLATTPAASNGAPPSTAANDSALPYLIRGAQTQDDVNRVARTGATIEYVEHGAIRVTATLRTVKAIEALGFRAESQAVLDRASLLATYPTVDPGYTTFAEMITAVDGIVAAHPAIAQRVTAGFTQEGRAIVALKISDNVAADEDETEVLFTANQHAREHLTVEQALFLANLLVDRYATDQRIADIVNGREIWIFPMVNPDGVEFDLTAANGRYRNWRKNRQPNGVAGEPIGTDLNRNWGHQWACCGGSSFAFGEDDYHGSAPFSAPETATLRDWVATRIVGGVQQIKAHIDIHSFSELVLYPYGYTTNPLDIGMTADDRAMFVTLARKMADRNGYVPGQASALYVADGDINDWMWFTHKIASFTFELFPGTPSPGFYPPASVIPAQTERNREALLYLLEFADCPYRAIGKETTYCTSANDFSVTPAPASASVAPGASATTTISTAVTGGAAQPVALRVLGLPPGATASFSPATVTAGGSSTMTVAVPAGSPQGAFPLTVLGDGQRITRSAGFDLTVQGNPNCVGTNPTDIPIADPGTTNSTITIAGCPGNANAHAKVEVHIKHTFVSDLNVSLVQPNGTLIALHRQGGDQLDDIDTPYVIDLSAVPANGTWKLRVTDKAAGDSGTIDSWTLTL